MNGTKDFRDALLILRSEAAEHKMRGFKLEHKLS